MTGLNIPTASQIIRNQFVKGEFEELMGYMNDTIEPEIKCAMIEFAKLHVEAALYSIVDNINHNYNKFSSWPNQRELLTKSYPLENIK